jgi:hypothetical protein
LYAINSEILYEDNYGHQVISGPQKIEVTVQEVPLLNNTRIILLLLAAAVIIIAGGAYVIYKMRKNKK